MQRAVAGLRGRVTFGAALGAFTSFKIGGPADVLVMPADVEDVRRLVVQAHGEIYFREYGWDERFEALVARIAGEFVDNLEPARERCWIAERDGERVGSVFLVKKSATIAKLRLLIVDPQARGLGIGRRLVDECLRFAREAGYRKITLWTHGQLTAARRIYQSAGFACVDRKHVKAFGKNLVDETWELTW